MRDPYRNVKDDVYVPLTYSIGSIVGPQRKRELELQASFGVVVAASSKIADGFHKMGKAFQDAVGKIHV